MRHLLSSEQLTKDQAIDLLDLADEMAEINTRENKKLPTLRGKTVVNLFFEDSTRTKTSFELAAKRLSADLVNFSAKGSSVSKGESLKDTALTLAAGGADAFVLRHSASGAAHTLANAGWTDIPVINAGDGTHEHPTQGLLDAMTIRERFHKNNSRGKDLAGVSVAIVGDILHSRVARSNIHLLNTLGADVTVVAPTTLMPNAGEFRVKTSHNLDETIAGKPDVLMMLRIQQERMKGVFFPNETEYSSIWGLTKSRFKRLPETTLIMHPGPMNRGLEICSEAADSSQSTIVRQVANGISVRMAVLFKLLAPERSADE
ncbi:MAG: hypothetical protein RIR24_56 [Actinomycetota bacterium]